MKANDNNATRIGDEHGVDTTIETDTDTETEPANELPADVKDEIENADESVQIKGYGPRWMREAIKDRDVSQAEAIRAGLRLYLGDDSIHDQKIRQLEQRKRELERKNTEHDAEIQRLENQKAQNDDEIDQIEKTIAAIEDQQGQQQQKYEQKLVDIETEMHEQDSVRYFESHPDVIEAAELVGKDASAVIDDLRERNPELPDWKFESGDIHDRY